MIFNDVQKLIDYAIKKELITNDDIYVVRNQLMEALKLTDWYFDFSKNLNYVRAGRIEKDLKWTYDCEYGRLDITINCSKPEKDPRDIAAAKTQKVSAYPECQLCPENAGFAGHATLAH